MWRNSLRDMRWRWRRYVVALAGAALVFASTLLMVGLSSSFHDEITDSLGAIGTDGWVVRPGPGGPFTSFRLLPQARAEEIAREPGVRRADPFLFLRQSVNRNGVTVDVNLIGYHLGGIGSPPINKGRTVQASGEVVVDDSLEVPLGGRIDVGGMSFHVVGLAHGLTLFGGSANVYMPISDVQNLLLYGQRVTNMILVRGHPTTLPPDLKLMSTPEVAVDVLRPLANAVGAVEFAQRILWFVAAFIIGAVVYTAALERGRDFAVFKATGVSSRYVLGGMALQAVILSCASALLAIGVARILVPMFPLKVRLEVWSIPQLFIVAIVIGLVASLFGARRAVTADPALAFAGP